LDVPEPPKAVTPSDGATDVDGTTEFELSGVPKNSISYVVWQMGNVNVLLVSGAAKVKLPDLIPYGLGLPKGQESTWGVYSEGPAANMDELVELDQRYYTTSSSVAESTYLTGSSRTFFTAP